MLDWLKSILGGKAESRRANERRLVPADAEHIAAAIGELEKTGLRIKASARKPIRDLADEIADRQTGRPLRGEPTIGQWAFIALASHPGVFENAASFDDHCYDGIDADGFAGMISEFIGLAGTDWAVDSITVEDAKSPGGPLQYLEPVTVTIHDRQDPRPFNLINDKDFDWSAIIRLNERLPPDASGRFWVYQYGGATVVYLAPADISRLNALCDADFINQSDESPDDEAV